MYYYEKIQVLKVNDRFKIHKQAAREMQYPKHWSTDTPISRDSRHHYRQSDFRAQSSPCLFGNFLARGVRILAVDDTENLTNTKFFAVHSI